jgi:hypothetical protein
MEGDHEARAETSNKDEEEKYVCGFVNWIKDTAELIAAVFRNLNV